MSSPEKRYTKKESSATLYVKRTQKDTVYGIQSRSTVVSWLGKYGNFDWDNQTPNSMQKTSEQRIMELEAEVKLLEKQKAFLERRAYIAHKKAIFFDMMIWKLN